ncbi:hypothetical protein CEXT_197241 [Caerostris extrusa]|uniref:Uncharacterized protein n=1 Tax=Caerostris extrusa TaxID=172846 RepID=A0AAV4MHD9_CAEEX|nr:hypothetical protein CEXT_197241 [Caerostris extrusa]
MKTIQIARKGQHQESSETFASCLANIANCSADISPTIILYSYQMRGFIYFYRPLMRPGNRCGDDTEEIHRIVVGYPIADVDRASR